MQAELVVVGTHGRTGLRALSDLLREERHQQAAAAGGVREDWTMRTVEQYMTLAPTPVPPDAPVAEAAALMKEAGAHHLPVLSGRRLVGLVTANDLAAFDDMPELQRHRLRVEDLMTPMPLAVGASTPLAEVAREMLRCRSSAAVVVQQGEVVGVFTLTDGLRALIELLEGKPVGRRMPLAVDRPAIGR